MPRVTHPQEIEVYYILPALRRELALALKAKGYEQKRISGLLGVTEASISHYINSKRASAITFDSAMKHKIALAASRITDVHAMVRETQVLLGHARNDKTVCGACHEYSSRDVPAGCTACFDHGQGTFVPQLAIPILKQ